MLKRDLKPTSTAVGRRLREARIRARLTQDALGVAIGLDEGNACIRISRYESGVHTPSVDQITALAKALGVPPAYLITDDDRLAALILDLQSLDGPQLARVEELLDELRPDDNEKSAP